MRKARSTRFHAGFTLVELLVTMLILMGMLIGLFALFQTGNKISKAETHVSDMQQSSRIAQYEIVRNTRMSGRGGVPAALAVSLRNNVATGTHIADGFSDTPRVLEGTDVFTVRGVFTSPIYQVVPGDVSISGMNGTLVVRDTSPTGVPQDLKPLTDLIDSGNTDALLLSAASTGGVYGVTTVTGGTDNGDNVALTFEIDSTYDAINPGGGFPVTLKDTATYVGILEEYRYYVRELRAIPTDLTSDLTPRLARARFVPGTETPHYSDPSLSLDFADNIVDLQVAMGYDTNADETVVDTADTTDEWLFNAAGDPLTLAGSLYFVRVSTLARTDRRDRGYVSQALTSIEDRDYSEPATPANDQQRADRMYRRRLLQTVVDLRNI